MSELAERVRKRIILLREIGENGMVDDFDATAARILELEAENKKLKEALKPFGRLSPFETYCNDGQSLARAGEDALACGIVLKVSDLRRAAALGEKP